MMDTPGRKPILTTSCTFWSLEKGGWALIKRLMLLFVLGLTLITWAGRGGGETQGAEGDPSPPRIDLWEVWDQVFPGVPRGLRGERTDGGIRLGLKEDP